MTKVVLDKWGQKIVDDLRISIKNKGLTASGKSARSLSYASTDTRLQVFGEDYLEQLQIGRRPTQQNLRGRLYGVIMQWIKDKGIHRQGISDKSLAYLIARKIDREGIKVPNRYNKGGVLSDVINPELFKQIEEDLGIFFINKTRSDIMNLLNIR